VNIGNICASCSSAKLPTGATISGCNTCSNSQGFFLNRGVCTVCAYMDRTTGAATTSGCVCTSTVQKWYPEYNSCGCYFESPIWSTTTIVNGLVSCLTCNLNGACSCGGPGATTIYSANGKCILCSTIPYATGATSGGSCLCIAGYSWNGNIYPGECYCSYKLGMYIDGTCKSCASLPSTGSINSVGCSLCSYTNGFVQKNDKCILCSSIANASGVATVGGCVCSSGEWNPINMSCTYCNSPYKFTTSSYIC